MERRQCAGQTSSKNTCDRAPSTTRDGLAWQLQMPRSWRPSPRRPAVRRRGGVQHAVCRTTHQ
eukprot:9587928-Alexandrium_andersonii.AAC.1